jgi:hypothetical protein
MTDWFMPPVNHLHAPTKRMALPGAIPINAILAAAPMNFHKLLGALLCIFLCCLMRPGNRRESIPALQWSSTRQTPSAYA